MSIVAFVVLYLAFAVAVGRLCRLNSRLEGTIVTDPDLPRRQRAPRAAPSARAGGAATPSPVEEAAGSRPLHEASAVR